MCDEATLAEWNQPSGVTRRGFAQGAAGALLAANLGAAQAAIAAGPALAEKMVDITTPDGSADAFFAHPAVGTHPGIVMWPDIAGLRETYKVMARRLAAAGYAVLVVNHYYRSGKAPFLNGLAEWMTPDGQAKIKPALAALTPEGTTRDAIAFVTFLDAQAAVSKRHGIGACGYCAGGPAVIRTAAAVPARVRAGATLHGAQLVTDKPDSPHLLLGQTRAAYLIAIARNDDAKSPTDKDTLRTACAVAHRPAEIAVYNADHGWCTLDAPSYNQAEAEKAWGRMLALFQTHLAV